ncbi:MAG: hypothetical protein J6N95_07775 [Bacilli bacterium]|nr:hypothetical protein [Bacilli bacterium]
MENNNRRTPVLTIIAAVFSGINILLYTLLIASSVTGVIFSAPNDVLVALIFIFPVISTVAFVFSLVCRRDRIKPFWIPNMVISIVLLLSALPASCTSTFFLIRNDNERRGEEYRQSLREMVYKQSTVEFIKEDMTINYESSNRYKEVKEQFISMEFTLLDVTSASSFELEDSPFYGINTGGGNEYNVTLFSDYSGIKIYANARDYRLFVGRIEATAINYYSCDKEEGRKLNELIQDARNQNSQSYVQ